MRWQKVIEWTVVFIIGVLTAVVTMAFAVFPKISEKAEKTYVDQSIIESKKECIIYTDKQIESVKDNVNKDKIELLNAIESVRKDNNLNTDRIINMLKK